MAKRARYKGISTEKQFISWWSFFLIGPSLKLPSLFWSLCNACRFTPLLLLHHPRQESLGAISKTYPYWSVRLLTSSETAFFLRPLGAALRVFAGADFLPASAFFLLTTFALGGASSFSISSDSTVFLFGTARFFFGGVELMISSSETGAAAFLGRPLDFLAVDPKLSSSLTAFFAVT